mgnify:CR=1 FL=1
MQKSKKLNISPLPEQADDYTHYEESEVHWGRIIAAGTALVLFIVLSMFFMLSGDEDPVQTDIIEDELSTTEKFETPPAPKSQQKVLPEIEDAPLELLDQQTEAMQATKTQETDIKTEPVNEPAKEIVNEPVNEPVNESVNESVEIAPEPASLLIVNSAITHAALSLSLKDNIPGEALAAQVILPDANIMKVILFTEMKGIRGQVLYHDWYRNGERQARVKIPVNVSTQRSFSSKFINRQMLGKWQVKVVDGSNEPYVLADFEVIDH